MNERRMMKCGASLVIFAISIGTTFGQDQSFEQLLAAVENHQRIEFTATQANPAKAGMINLTTFNNTTLIFTKDGSQADLPYFGRAQISGYGTDTGIVFNGPNEELKIKENEKKKRVVISFRVKSKSDFYRCNLILFAGGSASLNVIPNNRDRINFIGRYEIK